MLVHLFKEAYEKPFLEKPNIEKREIRGYFSNMRFYLEQTDHIRIRRYDVKNDEQKELIEIRRARSAFEDGREIKLPTSGIIPGIQDINSYKNLLTKKFRECVEAFERVKEDKEKNDLVKVDEDTKTKINIVIALQNLPHEFFKSELTEEELKVLRSNTPLEYILDYNYLPRIESMHKRRY